MIVVLPTVVYGTCLFMITFFDQATMGRWFPFLLMGVGVLWGVMKFLRYFSRRVTKGTVVDFHRDEQEDTYAPIVEFMVEGKAYRFTHPWLSSPPAFTLRQEVGVRYDAGSPGSAAIDQGVWMLFLTPLIFVGAGVLVWYLFVVLAP
jgi:hypothetical protein